ncbi:F-box protein At2g17036-like isoform X1 [Silene latifolia]|uniref:F-box protein At2g17036-like isoform X1 n=1 Tax=Silene latifolia TaxID=37657 RepID=UPI003D77C152
MAANDWSTLPLDLLGAIAMKLETLDDFIYFSAVCHTWNRVSSLIKHQWRSIVPWLLLAENTSYNPHCVRKIFNPSNNKCYKLNFPTFGAKCSGSDYGWVAMVDRNLAVCLFNPITKAEIRFPSAETIPDRRPYDEEIDENEEDYISWFLRVYMRKLIVLKVSQNEFIIVVIYDNFDHLAFAKQGDKSWTSVFVKQGYGFRMFDVMAMNGYVFALCSNASLVYWNIEDFQGYELVKPMEHLSSELQMRPFICGLGTLYLVESGCDLLMVLRFKEEVFDSNRKLIPDVYETLRFSVYRLDPKDKRWEEIKDHASLFVGGNSTMSVSAKGLQPNCIYFTDDEFELSSLVTKLGGHDMGVYDIKCKKKWRFYEGDDIRSAYCRPTWFIPQL